MPGGLPGGGMGGFGIDRYISLVKKNAPTREQMRLFTSNIKKLQQERIGAPSCEWTGEGGTLRRHCSR